MLNNLKAQEDYKNKVLEYKIKSILVYLGFDFSLLGSTFLKDIILIIFENPQEIHSLDAIYNKLAKMYPDAKAKSVERDIRWAINKAYKKGIIKDLHFFEKDTIPTVKQFINWLFDLLYLNIYAKENSFIS